MTFVKETVLGSKARAAADLVLKRRDPNQETNDLVALKNSVKVSPESFGEYKPFCSELKEESADFVFGDSESEQKDT